MSAAEDFRLEQEGSPDLMAVRSSDWLCVYRAHLKSITWRKIRKAKLDSVHGQCERCGSWHGRREVHHKTYERLGNERLEDLLVLCPDCHAAEDKIRAAEGKQRSEQSRVAARYSAAVDTYMTKKYGEDWWMNHEPDDVHGFDEWIERKGDDYA
jgi:hypothetical protein